MPQLALLVSYGANKPEILFVLFVAEQLFSLGQSVSSKVEDRDEGQGS